MDRTAAGNTRPAKVNPKDLLDINLCAFAQGIGIKSNGWTRSLRAGPQQALVHMLLEAMGPHHHSYEELFDKFIKLSTTLRGQIEVSIYENFSQIMDTKVSLSEFWVSPGDHEKLRKSDEKTRFLGKAHLDHLLQKYMVKNFSDFRDTVTKVRHLIEEEKRIKVESNGYVSSFQIEGLESFLRKFAPLANEHQGLYEEVHTFQVFPDGTLKFYEGQLQSYQEKDREKLRALLTKVYGHLKSFAADRLLKGDFRQAAALLTFLSTAKEVIDQDTKGVIVSPKLFDTLSECIKGFGEEAVPKELSQVIEELVSAHMGTPSKSMGRVPKLDYQKEVDEDEEEGEEETIFDQPDWTKEFSKGKRG